MVIYPPYTIDIQAPISEMAKVSYSQIKGGINTLSPEYQEALC